MKTRTSRTAPKPIKACACGRSFTQADWEHLPRAGEHLDDDVRAEMRNCPCGSTLLLSKVRVRVLYTVEQTDGAWLLFRRAGNGEPVAVGLASAKFATRFGSKATAESKIPNQRRVDRLAATRLNVELIESANDNAKGAS